MQQGAGRPSCPSRAPRRVEAADDAELRGAAMGRTGCQEGARKSHPHESCGGAVARRQGGRNAYLEVSSEVWASSQGGWEKSQHSSWPGTVLGAPRRAGRRLERPIWLQVLSQAKRPPNRAVVCKGRANLSPEIHPHKCRQRNLDRGEKAMPWST